MAKILIVDDDEGVRNLVTRILENDNRHRVITAENGKKGIKLSRKTSPDLIILDIILPDISGLEILKRLKEGRKTQNIPIVMLTGLDVEESKRKALYWYVEEYITKPFTPTIFSACIEKVISRQ